MHATQSETRPDAKQQAPADRPRRQEYPQFEQEFAIKPGTDIDAELDWTLSKAEEEAELRQANAPPPPPPGVRLGSAQYRVYCQEAYQILNMQVNQMKHELRDYYEEKRKQSAIEIEKLKKEMLSATPVPERHGNTA